MIKIRSIFLLATLCLGLLASTSVTAEDYENFKIGPGFGSRTGTGYTGGSRSAGQYGREGYCVGYIDDKPDHIIEVTAEMELTLGVRSDTDSVLVIVNDEHRQICDDDSAGNDDAQISEIFFPGIYEIYVGSFDENASERYTLHINEGSAAGIRPRANQNQQGQRPSSSSRSPYPNSTQGRYGNFTVGAGFTPDPQTATGISGYSEAGRVDAATYGRQCTGFIDTTPDHKITVTSTVNLRLTVSSEIDSILVVRGPAGTFCDDDSAGNLDAQINALFTPGEYEVYIGNIGEAGEYTLTVTENAQGGGYVT